MQRDYLLWSYAFRNDNLIASVCNKKVLGTLLVSCYFWIYDCWQLGVLNNCHMVYKTVRWTETKRIFICIKFCILWVHCILSWIFHANVSIFFYINSIFSNILFIFWATRLQNNFKNELFHCLVSEQRFKIQAI